MRGQILNYNPAAGEGIISGADGKRYTFKGIEFHGAVTAIFAGQEADFEVHEDGTATAVFPIPGAAPVYAKSKVAAGILAIILGGFGIHKFYLDYTGAGVTMLLLSLLTCFILYPVMSIIGLVEGIIYLTKTDGEFDQIYVRSKQPWF